MRVNSTCFVEKSLPVHPCADKHQTGAGFELYVTDAAIVLGTYTDSEADNAK